MWTGSEKSRYTIKRVPLTKNRLRAPLVARNNASCDINRFIYLIIVIDLLSTFIRKDVSH